MVKRPEVVITGLGIVSPIGVGREPFWHALEQGKSGVDVRQPFATFDSPVRLAAEVRDFDGRQHIKPRKSLKVMCRQIQLGVAAANLAVEDAQLTLDDIDPERLGTVLGTEMFYGELEEVAPAYHACMQERGVFDSTQWPIAAAKQLNPLWMLKYLPNMAPSHIAIACNAQGPCNSIVQDESSSLLAIMEAVDLIERGWVDAMLTGGTGSRLTLAGLVYRGDRHLSRRIHEPTAASRPFDAHRDGMVIGEGAGVLVLENRAHAEARGARIYASISGRGRTFHVADQSPSHEAIQRSIQLALAESGIEPQAISHVNAHGLSTPEQDYHEAQAIGAVLPDVPVTAPKSYFGNLGAGGGTVELAASVLALHHGRVPPTLNYEMPDPRCPIPVVSGQALADQKPAAIVLNQSPTGQAATLVIERL